MYLICMKDTKYKSNIENKIKSEEYNRRFFLVRLPQTRMFYNSVDVCSTQPCDNGGVCTRGDLTHYCDCPPGFGGVTCDLCKQPHVNLFLN